MKKIILTDKDIQSCLKEAKENLSSNAYKLLECIEKRRDRLHSKNIKKTVFSPERIVNTLDFTWDEFDRSMDELIDNGYLLYKNNNLLIDIRGKLKEENFNDTDFS